MIEYLPTTAKTVLDVGCGAGDNARLLQQRGCKVYGVTLSEAEAKMAGDYCEEIVVANIESEELPFKEDFFDVIIASHVLEHLVCSGAVLNKIRKNVKDGGILLAAVPNMANWRLRVRFLNGNWQREETGPLDRTHLHFYSFKTAPELLRNTAFRLESCYPGNPAIPLWPLRRALPKFCKAIDNLIGKQFPNFAAIQVILMARPTN